MLAKLQCIVKPCILVNLQLPTLGFLTHEVFWAAKMKTMHQGDEGCFDCETFTESLHYIMALEEGKLKIGPCSQKLPGMGSDFNSSHCFYFFFLWNILFTCFYRHIQEG